MHFKQSATVLTSALCVFLSFSPSLFATASPLAQQDTPAPGSNYWLASIERQGFPAYGDDPDYQLYRNVKDGVGGQPGAVGDGVTDDTEGESYLPSLGVTPVLISLQPSTVPSASATVVADPSTV